MMLQSVTSVREYLIYFSSFSSETPILPDIVLCVPYGID